MRYTYVVILFFLSFIGFSQNTITQDLKVGLVLSGGGAKGLAHIGTLKVIDSIGLRVDYVAGTSMGAIIGSLYASGYSGNQIDSIFKTINFDHIINDYLPRESKTFYERENSEKYAVSLPLQGFKLKLPTALSRGQNTYNLISKLTLHVKDVKDFSKLPIPFFCIATNIETGEEIILEQGNLAKSVLASGALPTVFQPVVINEDLLMDGGIVNNYPVDELKAKGVDVVIGVDVQDDLMDRIELNTAPDILLQINNFRTVEEMKIKSKKTDVYIKPDIKNFNVISFSEGRKIIDIGEFAAKETLGQLNQIKSKQTNKKSLPNKIVATDSIQINLIDIKGNNNYTRAYILGKLRFKANEKISYDEFSKGVNNLVATNSFDSFLYELVPTENTEGFDFHATVEETTKTAFIKFGLHYDNLYKSGLLVNFTKKRTLTKNDVMSLDLIFGDNLRYNFEYFIDKGFYWSIGVRSRYNQFHKNIVSEALLTPVEAQSLGVNKIDIELDDFTNQFYLQTLFTKDLALSLGAEFKHLKVKSETIIDNTEQDERIFENSNYFSLFGALKFDTYDNKYFPNEGFLFDADFHLYLHSSDYNKTSSEFSIAKAEIGYSKSFSDKFSINITTEGGFKIGEETTNYLNFVLGGYGNNFINNFMPFYGYDFLSIGGDSYVKARLTFDYEIFKKHHILLAGNFANIEDNIFSSGEWFTLPDYTGYALGYSMETFLGPIEAKYTWSPDTGESIWFFNLGFWF